MSDPHRDAVLNTYRFLRIGMVAIVALLAAAIVLEHNRAGCLQPSISAYYFTAAHAIFIAALCALGACLIAYHGSSDSEDALLNFSGFLAFIVAVSPTSRPSAGAGSSGRLCSGLVVPDIANTVSNNVRAVVFAGALVAAFRLWMVLRRRGDAPSDEATMPERPQLAEPQPESAFARVVIALLSKITARWVDLVGYSLVVAGIAVFALRRDVFVDKAHGVAAVTMFVGIILVMAINAYAARPRDERGAKFRNSYRLVTAFMIAALVTTIVAHAVFGGGQRVFWLEVAVLSAFTAFWVLQTVELFNWIDLNDLNQRRTTGSGSSGRREPDR